MVEDNLHARVEVVNYAGLHARAATELAKLARTFDATIELIKEGQRVNCSDVLQVLSLGGAQGESLDLEAHGLEAETAFDAVKQLFADGFGEELGPPS